MTVRELSIAAEIRRLAAHELGLALEVEDDEPLAGKLDSLMLLSLVVAVEDRFRIRITEDDAATTQALADLARLVARRAGAADGAAAAGAGDGGAP